MRQIPLTHGMFALVDDKDHEWLSCFRWTAKRNGARWYARVGAETIYMHRLILGVTDPSIPVDHIDGDGLNNTSANLRACSTSENMRNRGPQLNNSSGFKGVSWHRGGWRAHIKINRQWIHLGRFKDKAEAARCYDMAAIKLHGEFCRLNFPESRVT